MSLSQMDNAAASSSGDLTPTVVAVSTDTTLTYTKGIYRIEVSGTTQLTLPTPSASLEIEVVNIGVGVVTVVPSGTVNGAAGNETISRQYSSMMFKGKTGGWTVTAATRP